MVQLTKMLFLYEELCDEAKKNAKDWWKKLEKEDPAWRNEHQKSMLAALKLSHTGKSHDEMIKESQELKMTGYWADSLLALFISRTEFTFIKDKQLVDFYESAWKDDLKQRLNDDSYIEEAIIANAYTFTSAGERRN